MKEILLDVCAWYSLIVFGIVFLIELFGNKPPKDRFFETILKLPILAFIILFFVNKY